MVNLIIDGKNVTAKKDTTVLEAPQRRCGNTNSLRA